MSNFMTIYESRRSSNGTRTASRFRVELPPAITELDQHMVNSISSTNHDFLRCDCGRGQECFICNTVNTLQDLEQEFANVPNITVNIAEAIQSAMRGEESTNDVNVIPEYVAEGELEECGICFEKIKISEKFRALPCSTTIRHKFHVSCIDPWLSRKNTCPLCRKNVIG